MEKKSLSILSFLTLLVLIIFINKASVLGDVINVPDLFVNYNGEESASYMAEYQETDLEIGVGFLPFEEQLHLRGLVNPSEKAVIDKINISSKSSRFLRIKKNDVATFTFKRQINKCELIIQGLTKARISRYTLKKDTIPTDLEPGKYMYIFYIQFKNGYGIFEKRIEII
jgi:hypothetical protein